MELKTDYGRQKLNLHNDSRVNNFLDQSKKVAGNKEESSGRLKEVAREFSSIFIKQMFSSMRATLPEETLLDGGFAEDIFQDMLDEEISKMGAEREAFAGLHNKLYEQLKQNHLQSQQIIEQKGTNDEIKN